MVFKARSFIKIFKSVPKESSQFLLFLSFYLLRCLFHARTGSPSATVAARAAMKSGKKGVREKCFPYHLTKDFPSSDEPKLDYKLTLASTHVTAEMSSINAS